MAFVRAGAPETSQARAARAVLAHDERHLRRRALTLDDGDRVLVDLPEPVALAAGDRLILEDGTSVEIVAAPEALLEVRGRDRRHLTELAWHLGNRHLAAAVEPDRILVLRDHVIKAMLEGLGAVVAEVVEPFEPMRGAYAGQGGAGHHAHDHNTQDHRDHGEHVHDDDHDQQAGKPRHGQKPNHDVAYDQGGAGGVGKAELDNGHRRD